MTESSQFFPSGDCWRTTPASITQTPVDHTPELQKCFLRENRFFVKLYRIFANSHKKHVLSFSFPKMLSATFVQHMYGELLLCQLSCATWCCAIAGPTRLGIPGEMREM